MENGFAYEIAMIYVILFGGSYIPLGYLSNSRGGRNHLLVISSAFGLLSVRAGIPRITT
jgi:hypothetical protein